MSGIDASERGEELATFQLGVKRQVRRLHECFFDFDLRFIVIR